MTILMLAQVTAAPAPAAPGRSDCRTPSTDGEVVVCAPADQEQFRLRPLPDRYERARTGPGVELDLGDGVKANLYAAGGQSPDGKPANRVMVKFRIPF